jgi:hypothetical protein
MDWANDIYPFRLLDVAKLYFNGAHYTGVAFDPSGEATKQDTIAIYFAAFPLF